MSIAEGERVDRSPGRNPRDVALVDIERWRSKLAPPNLSANTVLRPRLLERLGVGAEGQATVIVAPAGWGKTTLLASWQLSGNPPAPIVWVRVDRGYDFTSFWSHVAAALANVGELSADPAASQEPWGPHSVLSYLAGGKVILVVEDFHHITSPEVWAGVDELFAYQPRGLHVVLSGRNWPRVALHRLRAADELTEIGTDELAFSAGEVAELFGEYGVDAPRSALGELQAKLEGWPCGLRLAARRAHSHADPAQALAELGEPTGEIAEYLTQEVLSPLPRRTRERLVSLSALDMFNDELVSAVTASANGARTLDRLHRDYGLTERVGGRGTWFRFRPLLRTVLHAEFRSLDSATRERVHVSAGRWYEDHGMPERAIHHWLCARSWERAGQVVIDHVEDLACIGELAPRQGEIAPAPSSEVMQSQRAVLLAVAASRVDRGDLLGADAILELPTDSGSSVWYDLLATVTLRLTAARRRGDVDAIRQHAEELIALSSTAEINRPGSGEHVRALALMARAVARLWQADMGGAEADLTAVATAMRRGGMTTLLAICSGWLALVAVFRRRLSESIELAHSILGAEGNDSSASLAMYGPAQAALAAAHDLRGNSVSAEYWRTSAQVMSADSLLRAYLVTLEARHHLAEGDPVVSSHVLQRFRSEHGAVRLPRVIDDEMTMLEAECLAAQGLLAAARSRFGRVVSTPPSPRTRLTEVRLLIAEHALQSALDVAQIGLEQARTERPDLVVELLLLQAQLSYLLARPIDASISLESACDLAATEEIRRPFLAMAGPLRPIMREHLARGTAHRQFLNDLLSSDAGATIAATPPQGQLIEPLTQRERRVLWYLPSKLSNTEIAADMYVSLNTIKTHIKSVYRKLGVNGRREAVARARQLDLL